MKEGLLGPKVENVAVAIVQDIIDQGEPMYYVYLLNLRDDIMEGVIINSVGYGELKADGEQIRTSTLRHTLEILLPEEAAKARILALENASVTEMHQYGRQLLAAGKTAEAFSVFEKNHKKNNGAWPTNAGMMRGYAGMGNLKKALEYAKLALVQAPDELNKKGLQANIAQLEAGHSL